MSNNNTRRTNGAAQKQSSGRAVVLVGTAGGRRRDDHGLEAAATADALEGLAGPYLRALVAIEAAGEGKNGVALQHFARGYIAAHERICAVQGRDSEGEARAVLALLLGTWGGVVVPEPAKAGTTNSEAGNHGLAAAATTEGGRES